MKNNISDLIQYIVDSDINPSELSNGIGLYSISADGKFTLSISPGNIVSGDRLKILGVNASEVNRSPSFGLSPKINDLIDCTYWKVGEDYYITNINGLEDIFLKTKENLGISAVTYYNELLEILEAYRDYYTDLYNAFNNWTVVPSDGGAALKASLSAYLAKVYIERQPTNLLNLDVFQDE